jgi:hypothetical protein
MEDYYQWWFWMHIRKFHGLFDTWFRENPQQQISPDIALFSSPFRGEILLKAMVNSFLCLTKHQASKTYGGVEIWLHAILNLDNEWSTSCLGDFISGEISPGTHSLGGWMDPWFDLDPVKKRMISFACKDRTPIPRFSSPYPTDRDTIDMVSLNWESVYFATKLEINSVL